MDMDKLIKILGMTGSSQDGEALVALRMAQKLMAAHGKTWKDLIGAPQAQQRQQGWHQQDWQQHGWDDIMRKARAAEEQRKRDEAWKREQAQNAYRDPSNDDIAMKHECLRMLSECPELLTDWEMDFLVSFEDRPDHWSMTDKQRAVFVKLRERFRKHRK